MQTDCKQSFILPLILNITSANFSESFDLPTVYLRLLGFTITAAKAADFNSLRTAEIGADDLSIDNQKIIYAQTPIRLLQAQEVCEACKFFRFCIDNIPGKRITVSVKITDTTAVYPIKAVLALHLTNEINILANNAQC